MGTKIASSVIWTVAFIFLLASGPMAATGAELNINATVSNIQAVTAKSSDVVLDRLGNTSYIREEIGVVTLDSNHPTGFNLVINSQNDGYIRRAGAVAGSEDEEIAYTLDLYATGDGALGSRILEPALSGLSPNNSTLTFSGGNASPTFQKGYKLLISTAVKGLRQGGYTDTLEITISNI
ncbi:MAG: hypothetical protein ACI9BD_000056 [Candidatus Marinamargulisbacteria bacterium]|jgi:hypothetical protein